MNVLVSVIIPVYNIEKLITKCVMSIIKQSYKNIEILIVNDGSSDESLNVLLGLQKMDSRIKVFDTPNGGPAKARNIGLRNCRGEFVFFVDGDDYIHKDAIKILVGNIQRYDCDLAVGRVSQVFADGHHNEFHFGHGKRQILNLENSKWFFEDASVFHPAWNKLYKKALILFEFDENLKRNEDIEFNGKYYCNAKKMVVVNKLLYFQSQRRSSLTHEGRKVREEIGLIKRVYDEVVSYIETLNMSPFKKREIDKYLNFRLDILFQMIIYDDSDYKTRRSYMRMMQKYFRHWKYSLIHEIKSNNINFRYLLFHILYTLKIYCLLYHYKDITNFIRPIRSIIKSKNYVENMFE